MARRGAKSTAILVAILGLLFGISAAGAFVQRVFLTLTPIIGAEAGKSEATGAVVLSLYLGSQALGTLIGGALADRMDRRHILLAATTVGVPLHVLAVVAPPAGSLAITATTATARRHGLARRPHCA